MTTPEPFDKYLGEAAQLWCLPEFENKVMEPEFCKAIAAFGLRCADEALERAASIAETYVGEPSYSLEIQEARNKQMTFTAETIRSLKSGAKK